MKSELTTRIGKNLQEVRENTGLSLYALEEVFNLSIGEILEIEAGELEATFSQLDMFAEFYGTNVSTFIAPTEQVLALNKAFDFKNLKASTEQIRQIGSFRRIVENYLKMERIAASND